MQRKTNQREAIKSVLQGAGRPLSPQEILDGAKEHSPSIGIATVYRAVKELAEAQWLRPVELAGEPARYELSNMPHHHHFACRQCHRVFDLAGCPGDLAHLVPPGFKLEDHEITFRGLCPECSGTPHSHPHPSKGHCTSC